MEYFNVQIHIWFSQNKRDLPWRDTRDPYKIWLSEIILQQTRIDQGLAYYLRFIDEFPTIGELADAPEDRVLKLWQGLGYYSRARNLHATAKEVKEKYNEVFPSEYEKIKALKGVGEYTAAAISSISFNLEYPVVDGNVYRVLARFFGIFDPIDTVGGKKVFMSLANELIEGVEPGMHNQALMEFGALQCKPVNPNCLICPVAERCYAFSHQKVSELPVKEKKTKQRDRYFSYLVIQLANDLFIRKRDKNDIWKNLYEFPLIESKCEADAEEIWKGTHLAKFFLTNKTFEIEKISGWKIHLLSHQRIHYRFILIKLKEEPDFNESIIRVSKEDIFNFAVPRLLEAFLDEYLKNE
jgi:A/G-specific adenine glycosylase